MPEQGHLEGITRRRFVRDAVVGAVAAADLLAAPAVAVRPRRPNKRQPSVAVFGGGIAGLTAAHELAERGFEVTVYERREWGGRVRGAPLAGTGVGHRDPLPSEHSFHVYFGVYRNLNDTMRRIPAGSYSTVLDNLVSMPQALFARAGKRDLVVPLRPFGPRAVTPVQVRDFLIGALLELELPPEAAAYFADRIVVHLSSCDARRHGELDRIPWTRFIRSDRWGGDYERVLGQLPQLLWAAKSDRASADFIAWSLEYLIVYNLLGFGTEGGTFRVLDGPSYDAWLNPWLAALRRLGVGLRRGHETTGFALRGGRVSGARMRTRRGQQTVRADWYVCALPVQRARRLWNEAILAAAPALGQMRKLETANCTGVDFYLRENAPIARGVVQTLDGPWAPVFLNQAQFFARDFASGYGDGSVRDCVSVAIANWDRPGIVYGKPVRDCTPDEYAREIWEQIKTHVNKPGQPPRLTDDMLARWQVDDGIHVRRGQLTNEQPLVIPIAGTRQYRPDVATAIPNLMLAGDYVSGEWEIGHMEAANFAGRRAANAILDRAGSRESPATTVGPYRPPEWEPLRRIDTDRYRRGQPNLLDLDVPTQSSSLLESIVAP